MKKGVNTIDALFAIMLILFLTTWIQNFTEINLNGSSKFGGSIQADYWAISLGSQMNSFYATNPSAKDYVDLGKLPQKVSIFGQAVSTTITKDFGVGNVLYQIMAAEISSATYPVAKDITYSGGLVKKQ